MKIIISRKGFDSENGGCPSPVLPDGTLLSLPIPADDWDLYRELRYGNKTYLDIWSQLKPSKDGYYFPYSHLDPDIRIGIRKEHHPDWRAVFGQAGAAETHLENQGVSVGDLFMFFGWFRQTEEKDDKLKYKKGVKDVHILYGYLQIGDIARGKDVKKYPWHPHSYYYSPDVESNNTLYIASDELVIDGVKTGLPGYGVFKYSDDVVLTMPGQTKSRWLLPEFFKEVSISHHSPACFKPGGYFQTVRIGQEFVVSEDKRVTEWAKNIIENNIDLRNAIH